jgi:anaerobic selenocysteine-containing dehydrogenase
MRKIIPSVCGGCQNDCPNNVVVDGNRVVAVIGAKGNEITDGILCARGLAGPQVAHDPRRLLYPMKRKGKRGDGVFKRISWDEALSELAEKMNTAKQESGPHAVAFCRGQACGWGFPYDMLQRLTHAFGTEPSMGGSECFVPRAMGECFTYGGMIMLFDYKHTDLIIIWGRQPAFSMAPQVRKIYDARDRGAKLIVIDPLNFHLAVTADQYIGIEPGTDLAMMLAMMYVIIEEGLWDVEFVDKYTNDPGLAALRAHIFGGNRLGIAFTPEWAESICGVGSKIIRDMAHEYATTPRACILPGHGLEGRTNVTQTSRALGILRLITGHVDAVGSDILALQGPPRNPDFFLEERVGLGIKRTTPVLVFSVPPYNPPQCTYPLHFSQQGLIPTPDALRIMKEGKIKVAFIQGNNTMVMLPQPSVTREALEKVSYLAVVDPYLTETGKMADLVLPAATYLERTEPEWLKYGYALNNVKLRQQAVTVGEAWPDYKVIIELGRHLGLADAFPNEDVEWYIDELFKGTDITYQKLLENPDGTQIAPIEYHMYKKTGIHLPGGKAHIYSEILACHNFDGIPVWEEPAESRRMAPDLAKEYPFILFSGRSSPLYVHCQRRTIPWFRELTPDPLVMIHPDDASRLGIKNGDWTIIESPRGHIRIKAEVTQVVMPTMLYIPGGWEEANFNELGIDDVTDPISSQPNYMMCLGRIRKQ